MQKTLLRQLKRCLGVNDETELAGLIAAMQSAGDTVEPPLRGLFQGFGQFLERIDSSYEQYERDLGLRTRSLELSSAELSGANDRLRLELKTREEALRSLREVVRDLVPEGVAGADASITGEHDIAVLSRRIGELVAESEQSRRDLANQKFALDQHAIVSITDPAGSITYANDRFCEISGYSRAELIGRNHRILSSGLHPPAMFQEMWGLITAGKVWHGDICNRSRDGRLYWVNATIVPLLDAHGLPAQYIGIRTDITDRKRMEGQLSEQLHLVEELIEAIPLPVYLKDREGRYIRLNRAFELFFGVRRADFIGRTLEDLLPPADAALHLEKDRELFATRGLQTYEAEVHSQAGVRHDTIYRKAILTRSDGELSGLLGIIIDITERKEAEAALLQAKDAAESASRAKSDFLANMSHEIRTPMNGIIGMTDLALDTALTDEQRNYLDIVKSSAESLLTVINDILDFSKIEAGKLLVEAIPFDLHQMVTETLKMLALRAHEKGLELTGEIMPDVPQHLCGDPGRIRQVLINLVGNAIKFTERGKIALHIRVAEQHDDLVSVHFAVQDTGIGISSDKQNAIFDAFAQEDTSTTRRYGGTGLGLSISRRLVELMGGRIWLESTLGMGSTFHFSIALRVDGRSASTVHPSPMLPDSPMVGADADQFALNVLLVEDHPINQKLALGLLEKWGHRATLAGNGDEAIRHFERQRFDLILMDMQMPVMSGPEATRRIREIEHRQALPHTPIVAMTAAAMEADRQACLAAGMDDYLAKPIKTKVLWDKLQAYTRLGSPQPATLAADFDYAAALLDADREIVDIIASAFLATWQRDIGRLREAIGQGDVSAIECAAHSMRSTLASFGAAPAVQLVAELELHCRNRRLDGMADKVDALEREIRTLDGHLKLIAGHVSG